MMLLKSVHLEKENKTGKSACFDQLNHLEIYFVKTKGVEKGSMYHIALIAKIAIFHIL